MSQYPTNWLVSLEQKIRNAERAYARGDRPHICMTITQDMNPDDEIKDVCGTCHECPFDEGNISKTLEEIELMKPQLEALKLIKD